MKLRSGPQEAKFTNGEPVGGDRIRILMLEDDADDADMVERMLNNAPEPWSFAVRRVERLAEAVREATTGAYDVALLDLSVPDGEGLDVATAVRRAAPLLPLLVLTGNDDLNLALQAVATVAQDYLVKWDFNAQLLARSIHYARERERTDERLRQAMRQAESASRSKSDFLANLSHEVRTSMNIVLGMADLLTGTPLAGTQRETLYRLQTAGEHLVELTDDILDLSRVEAGKLDIEHVVYSPGELLRGVFALARSATNVRTVDLRLHLGAEVPRAAKGDPRRLRQVLLNLLHNAQKFTRAGHVEVGVERDGESLRYWVADTGIGIPTEHLESVFLPFVQAASTTARPYGGTGLGLSIAAGIVRALGGRIWVDSVPHQGTTFCFCVPLEEADPSELESLPRDEDTQTAFPFSKQVRRSDAFARVLLIDDCADHAELVTAYLAELPASLDVRDTAEGGLSAFAATSYDLVMVDMQLPGSDGPTIVRGLREIEREGPAPRARTPILMLSADALAESVARATRAGADGYLTKPIRKSWLLRVARRFSGNAVFVPPEAEAPDPDVVRLAPGFLRSRRESLQKMRQAAAISAWPVIFPLAHKLKGTAAAFGFHGLSEIGARLETSVATGDADLVNADLDALEAALTDIEQRSGLLPS